MTTKDKILQLFHEVNELTVKEIVENLGISKQMVHLVLKKLAQEGRLEKLGSPPKTIYRFIENEDKRPLKRQTIPVTKEESDFLEKNFVAVTETGNLLEGAAAFVYWCNQRKQPVEKTMSEFITTKKKYEKYYDDSGLINGMEKLTHTKGYEKIWLDDLYYLDFYAIERFGKTRLGNLLHYAKQGQNKFLMRIIMNEISPRTKTFLQVLNADAVGFVPPTIRREVQLMKFMQSQLKIALPLIEIKKISGIIPVPQKSLNKMEERIRNAENTFAVTERRVFQHVVLIDDAVGSGATLNQLAGKIKRKGIARRITGLSIVGSFKGFDIITDV